MAYLELIGFIMGRGDWDLQRSWNFNTTWVHVSFSVSDLNHCTAHLRWFSKDADMFTDEYKGLALSFDLTWKDLNVILSLLHLRKQLTCGDKHKLMLVPYM